MQDQPRETSSELSPPVRGELRAQSLPIDTTLHWILLAMAASVILAACVLQVHGEEYVVIPGVNVALPGTCSFKRVVGADCPGCGLTRCFVSMAHGDLRRAWSFNPVGILFFAVVAVQIPFRLIQLWRMRRGIEEIRLGWWGTWLLAGVAVALIVQWVARWLLGSL